MAGCTVVLEGTGVSDVLVAADESLRRIHPFLAFWAAQRGMSALAYSLAGGVRPLPVPGAPVAEVPAGIEETTPATVALDVLIAHARRSPVSLTVVVDFVEGLLSPDGGSVSSADAARMLEQLAGPGADTSWAQQGHCLILIARTASATSRLTSLPGVTVLPIGLPDLPERTIIINRMLASPRRPLRLAKDLRPPQAARLTGGLTADHMGRMRARATDADPLNVATVIKEKSVALGRDAGDTLHIHADLQDLTTDVAGLPQVRQLMVEVRNGGGATVRVIFSGPPGTGKTLCSTAIATVLGVPAVSLGRIRAPYVGQAEDNLNRALAALEAMAPVLLIIDECDEAGLGKRGAPGGEGSEVTANLRARLFGWLGDNGDQLGISVIGTTNFPNRLDPAAIDRFTIVPVLQPSTAELVQIMAIQARRQHIAFDTDDVAEAVRGRNISMSGREGVRLVGRAVLRVVADQRQIITGGDVTALLDQLMTTGSLEEEYQSLLAVAATTWTAHLPWIAAAQMGIAAEIPRHLLPFVSTTGAVDLPALRARIHRLERGDSS